MNSKNKRRHQHAGFTLIEVSFAIVIVGIAILSLMLLLTAGTGVNSFGNELSTAVFLAEQLQTMTDQQAFDQIIADGNQTFAGVDAEGNALAGLNNYQQNLSVQPVNPVDLTAYIGPDPQVVLLNASVSRGPEQLIQLQWLRVRQE